MDYDTEITKSIINLMEAHEIKQSELFMKYFNNKIKFYTTLLNDLKDSKPFFFQKKKLEEYYNKVKEYEEIIEQAYINIGIEVDYISTFQNNIEKD